MNPDNSLDDALRLCGFSVPAAPPGPAAGPVTAPNPDPSPEVAPAQPGFIEPTWFRLLKFAVTGTRAGAILYGPPSTGKTTAVHELARRMGVVPVTFCCAEGNTLDDLVGTPALKAGDSVERDGPLPEALRADTWLVLEEANKLHPGCLGKVHTLTDGSGDSLRLADGSRLKAGPGFRLMLLWNPGCQGTRPVNEALMSRLVPIWTTHFTQSQESDMIAARTGCGAELAERLAGLAVRLRAAKVGTAGFDLPLRALFRMAEMARDIPGLAWSEGFRYCVLDLVGDPITKKPQRDVLEAAAMLENLDQWPAWGPSCASASTEGVADDDE